MIQVMWHAVRRNVRNSVALARRDSCETAQGRVAGRCGKVLAGGVWALMFATANAAAQSSPNSLQPYAYAQTQAGASFSGGGYGVNNGCLSTTSLKQPPTGTASVTPATCSFAAGVTGSASASATVGGPLRAYSSISANTTLDQAFVVGVASFGDILRFSGLAPSYVSFQLFEDGSIVDGDTCTTAGGARGCAATELSSVFVAQGNTPSVCTQAASQQYTYGNSAYSGYTSAIISNPNGATGYFGSQTVSNTRTVVCSVAPNGTLNFNYTLSAYSYLFPGTTFDVGRPVNSTSTVDFSSTAMIAGLQFLDANKQIVSQPVQYSSDGGARYAVLSTTVPEPSTVALLAFGLTGVFIARRKRGLAA